MKPEKWVFLSDNHGNKMDPAACAVAFEFIKQWKPSIRIHGGDCFEFAALRKGASEQERREDLDADIAQGLDFIRRYKPTHFLIGNHDTRCTDMIDSDDGKLAQFAREQWAKVESALGNAKVYPYDAEAGVMKYGNTSFIHGYSHGPNAATAHAMAFGHCISGHVHATSVASVGRHDKAVGYTVGALCQLRAKYNRSHLATLRANHGFAYGLKLKDGTLITYQAQSHDGIWYLPSEIRQIKGRRS